MWMAIQELLAKETVEQNFMNFDAEGLRKLEFGPWPQKSINSHIPCMATSRSDLSSLCATRNSSSQWVFDGRMVVGGEGREA